MTKQKKPTAAVVQKSPMAGEQWEFKASRQFGLRGATNRFPPATVITVEDGWVHYAIGKSHPSLRKRIEVFMFMYYPADPWVLDKKSK